MSRRWRRRAGAPAGDGDALDAGPTHLEDRLGGALLAFPDGVVVVDADGGTVLRNAAAERFHDARHADVLIERAVKELLDRARSGTADQRDLELFGPPKQVLRVRAQPLEGEDGLIGAVAFVHDLSEARRVESVRRDFVANVSHELKTPIGALQLLAEALLDATELADATATAAEQSEDIIAARRFAERIHHESARMGRLVNELLELTRLQGAEPLPTPEPVALDWVIAEVVDRTRTTASAKNIEVIYTGPKGATVYGSDTQVATAVTNLVENAIAYSGEDTKVSLTMRQDEDWIEIDVADQGIGIAPHDVDRIFERFYRADQARSRSTGGTGLGLAIVKHIATNHGGRVDVSSTLGGGSTFTLRLPARPPEAPPPLPAAIEIESGVAGL